MRGASMTSFLASKTDIIKSSGVSKLEVSVFNKRRKRGEKEARNEEF